MALLGIVNQAKTQTEGQQLLQLAARDPAPSVRMASLLVMRRLQDGQVEQFLEDKEPRIVAEAARAIHDASIERGLPRLGALISRAQEFVSWPVGTPEVPGPRDPLFRRILNANLRLGTATAATALAQFASNEGMPGHFRAEALTLLGDWAKPSGRDRITGLWRPLPSRPVSLAAKAVQPVLERLLRDSATPIRIAAARVAAQLDIKAVSPELYGLAVNNSQPTSVRIQALKSLASLKDRKLPDALKIALNDNNETLRNEAVKIQAQFKPKDATAQIRSTLERGSIKEKQNALATLGTMPGAAADEILGQWLDKLISRQLAPELQLDFLDAAAKRTNALLKAKLQRFDATRDPNDDLRAFRECLVGGDAQEGRTVFFEKPEASCVRCHKIGNEGNEVGPNLTGLGTRQTREYILESIIFPNKKIAPGFETLLVTLKNDTSYAGILKAEGDLTLEINSPEDGLVKINKPDIKARSRGLSGMPEELRQVLTKQDVRNLVEFLSTTAK